LNYVRERYLQTEEIFINKYQIGFAVYNTGTSSLPSLIIDSFFSTVNYHAMATSLALSATNLFQFYANSSRKMIRTINQPILTPSKVYSSAEQFFELLYCFDTIPLSLFNFLNAILASIFMSILLVPIVHERVTHSKDLQLLTNLSKKIYWFSNVCFDLSLCLLLSTLLTIIVQVNIEFFEFIFRLSIQLARCFIQSRTSIRSSYLSTFNTDQLFLSAIFLVYARIIAIDLRLFISAEIGINWFCKFFYF